MKLTPLCLLLAAVLLSGCGRSRVESMRLEAADAARLSGQLTLLDSTLREKSPAIAVKLSPGISPAELQKLRDALDGAQIEPLEIWLQWHNGSSKGDALLLPLGFAQPLDASLVERKQVASIPFIAARRKLAFKLLEDGSGDGFFLDLSSPGGRVFYHMLEDGELFTDFGRLDEFAGFIAQVHQAGLAAVGEGGAVIFDLPRYAALEARYLANKSRP
jgi:hypothetical protein